jgi:AraC-like DNA-binding protein
VAVWTDLQPAPDARCDSFDDELENCPSHDVSSAAVSIEKRAGPGFLASHRRLANSAREALIADPGLGVTDLARIVGCSPFHLSRVFRRETETTISEYRLRLRVREALARISAGEENLARLATDLGFSDHSHLTRLLVLELGETPTAIRRASRGAL